MEKKINPVLKRLSDFADSKGGFAEIGRRIDKHPSMFYNLVRRDALPSLSTLTEIANKFPDLDMNYVIRGTLPQNEEAYNELRRLKDELEFQKAIVGKLVGKLKGTKSLLAREKELRVETSKATTAKMRGFNRHSKPVVFRAPANKLFFRFSDN